MEPQEALNIIASEVESVRIALCTTPVRIPFPVRVPADAQIMFIGEGPGVNENEQGRPFVGAAGKLLEDLLAKAGLTRKDVFICNVVKCRPPGEQGPVT